ncbi:MAG: class I SAM-dependent methyltransferase [Psychrobacillus sp.]
MVKNMTSEDSIKRWDKFAEKYAANHLEHGDPHKEVYLNPTLFSLMGNLNNKKVLDAGCGEGYLSRLMEKAGAAVTAIDYSSKMIEIAKSRTTSELNIEFKQSNCENLHFIMEGTYDVVVSNMVIQDLEGYQQAFNEIYRVLREGGIFIFSILHPCFQTPESGWEKGDDGKKLYWKVDNYFYEGAYEQRGMDQVIFYHRTLTSYVKAICEAGFLIEEIVEPTPSEEMLKKYPTFREDFRSPDFIVFRLKK